MATGKQFLTSFPLLFLVVVITSSFVIILPRSSFFLYTLISFGLKKVRDCQPSASTVNGSTDPGRPPPQNLIQDVERVGRTPAPRREDVEATPTNKCGGVTKESQTLCGADAHRGKAGTSSAPSFHTLEIGQTGRGKDGRKRERGGMEGKGMATKRCIRPILVFFRKHKGVNHRGDKRYVWASCRDSRAEASPAVFILSFSSDRKVGERERDRVDNLVRRRWFASTMGEASTPPPPSRK